MQITKSDFLLYLEEPLHFWAAMHEVDSGKAFGEFAQHLAQQGQQTERLARQYLETVVLPTYADAVLLWQPEFRDGPFFARLDGLIHDRATDTYDLVEIKSATSPTNYTHDIAFQHAICQAHVRVQHAYVLHLNRDYRRVDALDLASLFTMTCMDEAIAAVRDDIALGRRGAVRVSAMNAPHGLSACVKPKDCPYPHLCHADLPRYSIYDLPRISRKKIDLLRSQGITAIHDIPLDFALSTHQQAVADVVRSGQPVIDREAIRARLDEVPRPLAFLDYEAVTTAIPAWHGYGPNQNVAFQYSLHILTDESATLTHHAYLANGTGDAARALAEDLARHMPESGAVVVWNQSYEGKINEGLAERYPQYAAFALGMNARMFDLMKVFSEGLYRHPDFHGSSSIKLVLPVLVPKMSYQDMAVAHGGQAVWAWNHLIADDTPPGEREQLRQDMLAYCNQDTLAMVEIWHALRRDCA
jgi:hypothetical protein